MNKPSVYLDTSVINFLFADDSPELQAVTKSFFTDFIRPQVYHACVSGFVLDELRQTPDAAQRAQLLHVVEEYEIEVVTAPGLIDIEGLARHYLGAGALPANKIYTHYDAGCAPGI